MLNSSELHNILRTYKIPIVARIEKDYIIMDLRTVQEEEEDIIIQAVSDIMQAIKVPSKSEKEPSAEEKTPDSQDKLASSIDDAASSTDEMPNIE